MICSQSVLWDSSAVCTAGVLARQLWSLSSWALFVNLPCVADLVQSLTKFWDTSQKLSHLADALRHNSRQYVQFEMEITLKLLKTSLKSM